MWRRCLAAVVLGAVALGCSPSKVRPPPSGPTVVQLNLCGNVNSGAAGCTRGDHSTPATRLAAQIEWLVAVEPDVLTLNEACLGQYDDILAALREEGWEVDGRFAPSVVSPALACEGPSQYGNAVVVRGSMSGEPRVTTLSTPGSPEGAFEVRNVVCADADVAALERTVGVCSTHVMPRTSGAGEHDRQLHRLGRAMEAELDRRTELVLGGDLNASSEVVAAAFAVEGLHDTGDDDLVTYGRDHRYDYVFLAGDLHPAVHVGVERVPATDHRAVAVVLGR